MVSTNIVIPEDKKREEYMELWCRKGEEVWGNCTRFATKKTLGFCPDFVVPDTPLSLEEIIDKFEEENE